MRIIVHVLLNLEGTALFLHLQAEYHIQVHILGGSLLIVLAVNIVLRIVGILYIIAAMLPIRLIHTGSYKVLVHILLQEVLTLEVNHRTGIAGLVNHEQGGDTGILGNLGVIGTEGRCDMNDTRTVLGSHIVTGDYTEGVGTLVHYLVTLQCAGLNPGHQLLIVQTCQVSTLSAPQDFQLLALLSLEVSAQTTLSQDIYSLFAAIGIAALNGHIVNLGSDAEGRIRRQSPRGCGPGQNIKRRVESGELRVL